MELPKIFNYTMVMNECSYSQETYPDAFKSTAVRKTNKKKSVAMHTSRYTQQ